MALLGVGAICFLLWAALQSGWLGSFPTPGTVRFWLADRDEGSVWGLDESAFVVSRREAPGVLEVVPLADRSLWALSAERPGGRTRRVEPLMPRLGRVPSIEFPEGAHSLAAAGTNTLGLLTKLSGEGLWVQLDREARPMGSVPAGEAFGWEWQGLPEDNLRAQHTGSSALVLVGKRWLRWHFPHRVPFERRLQSDEEVLSHSSERGTLSFLVRLETPGDRLLLGIWEYPQPGLRGRTWSLRFPLAWERGTWDLVPTGAAHLWIVSSLGHAIRFDRATGRCAFSLLQAPIVRALSDGGGGLLALSPGGVERLGPEGVPLPGQGGYAYLCAGERGP